MSVEPIGIIALLAGLISLVSGYRTTVVVAIFTTLLGSAGAILIGGTTIQPAHLMLAFLAAATLTRRREAGLALRALSITKPGFWLAAMVLYGVVGAQLLPRMLAGSSQIIPIGTSEYAFTNSTVPLGPTSGNLTQPIYLVADVFCFLMISAVASIAEGARAIILALISYAAANIAFAAIDVITFSTGTASALSFIRNAQYALHLDEVTSGMKRISGSFTEASAFAHATAGALGFTATLWICNRYSLLTGSLACASAALLALSTSSTALLSLPVTLLIAYFTALSKCSLVPKRRNGSIFVFGAPPLLIAATLALFLDREKLVVAKDYINSLIFDKAMTQSGLERASWNAAALQNFWDSWGLGVGLGTARASSFPLAVLSNLGIVGAVLYTIFIVATLSRAEGATTNLISDGRLAARNACLGLLVADTLSGALVDQGLIFYVFAALAAASGPRRQITAEREESQLIGYHSCAKMLTLMPARLARPPQEL